MKLFQGLEGPAAYRGGFVAIGNFDGVHRGHQSMISVLVQRAREAQVPAVVFTFAPHPIELLKPGQTPPSLSTVQWKAELLGKCGIDCTIAYRTDQALLNLTPEQFFGQIIRDELDARGLVEGPNFFFGRNRTGNIATLETLCDASGLKLEIVPPVKVGERLVSSSAIRRLIGEGKISEAIELLGHSYRIQGTVIRGAARGRTIGFPTANLERVSTLLPCDGVYAGLAHSDNHSYPAAVNLGPNPTFGEQQRKLEVHLLDFSGDLYGRQLDVDFLKRIRDTSQFANVDDLQSQLERDVDTVRMLVTN